MKDWVLIFLFTSFLKLLLFHFYHSTDFEVHRNWLAITHSLPLSQWYYDTTSQWTLDYPPFFAYFEYALSQIAAIVDKKVVQIDNLEYSSTSVKLFQRLSVILSDVVLCYACSEATEVHSILVGKGKEHLLKPITTILYLLNAGLLIVDHIHFQYNGLLSGLLLLSLTHGIKGNTLLSAILFSTLLNFKHIYLYVAPAYFVFMFGGYCCRGKGLWGLSPSRLVVLGGVVVSVFGLSLGPFIKHLPQVASRLFPVQRGLCHAYWAPNVWALYNAGDIVLSKLGKIIGFFPELGTHPLMSGLVQISDLIVLPNIYPLHTVIITLLTLTSPLYKLWSNPTPEPFVRCVTTCAFVSYMFGYHVHEKAILVVLIPCGLLALISKKDCMDYILTSIIGTCSLFPLLFQPQECLIKVCIFILCHSAMIGFLLSYHGELPMTVPEMVYIMVLLLLQPVCWWVLPVLLPNLVFLPLMIVSVYSTLGNFYCFARIYSWVFC